MNNNRQGGLGRRALLGAAGGVLAGSALAQRDAAGNWPERNITFVVCFPPGGSTDVSARLVAPGAAEILGRPIVIENRAGAGGNIGIGAVARAAPDGYTMLVASSVFVVNSSLYRHAPYDPFKDFAPVALLGASPNVVAVRSELGINSLDELIRRVKAQPDKFNCGLPGIGTTPHLAAEVLKLRTGMPLQLVPFNGAGPASQAILSGTTECLIASQGGQVEVAYRAGQIKLLAQTGATRSPDMPDIPTLTELGIEDAVSETFNALYAPAGTPRPIIDKTADAVLQVLRRPDIQARYRQAGVMVVGEGPDGLAARVAREVPQWREVIRQAKISVE
jgi:tripartite-type tricarboxylate transporter receptor subunit TctC